MKFFKWLSVLVGIYIVFVVIFEAGYLGAMQPSFEDNGIPMMVLITTDEEGEAHDRMLAQFPIDGTLYVSAHHWPRGWYHRAVDNPDVQVDIDGEVAAYTAVPVPAGSEEFDRVDTRYPMPFVVNLLMGFPPERDILRLDPVAG